MSERAVTIVTGAAGGVGRAVVQELLEAGGQVVAEDIDPSVLELASDDVATLIGDVADERVAREAVAIATQRFGRLTGLVNNAGRFNMAPLGEITVDQWDAVMRTNVRGPFVHLKAAQASLVASRGAVVNTGSIAGLVGLADQVLYGATKGAVHQITKMAAIELAPSGVRVNAVAPGHIETRFMDDFLPDAGEVREAIMSDIRQSHPIGRSSTPQEVARVIAFLLSPAATTITGVILPVDGGHTAA